MSLHPKNNGKEICQSLSNNHSDYGCLKDDEFQYDQHFKSVPCPPEKIFLLHGSTYDHPKHVGGFDDDDDFPEEPVRILDHWYIVVDEPSSRRSSSSPSSSAAFKSYLDLPLESLEFSSSSSSSAVSSGQKSIYDKAKLCGWLLPSSSSMRQRQHNKKSSELTTARQQQQQRQSAYLRCTTTTNSEISSPTTTIIPAEATTMENQQSQNKEQQQQQNNCLHPGDDKGSLVSPQSPAPLFVSLSCSQLQSCSLDRSVERRGYWVWYYDEDEVRGSVLYRLRAPHPAKQAPIYNRVARPLLATISNIMDGVFFCPKYKQKEAIEFANQTVKQVYERVTNDNHPQLKGREAKTNETKVTVQFVYDVDAGKEEVVVDLHDDVEKSEKGLKSVVYNVDEEKEEVVVDLHDGVGKPEKFLKIAGQITQHDKDVEKKDDPDNHDDKDEAFDLHLVTYLHRQLLPHLKFAHSALTYDDPANGTTTCRFLRSLENISCSSSELQQPPPDDLVERTLRSEARSDQTAWGEKLPSFFQSSDRATDDKKEDKNGRTARKERPREEALHSGSNSGRTFDVGIDDDDSIDDLSVCNALNALQLQSTVKPLHTLQIKETGEDNRREKFNEQVSEWEWNGIADFDLKLNFDTNNVRKDDSTGDNPRGCGYGENEVDIELELHQHRLARYEQEYQAMFIDPPAGSSNGNPAAGDVRVADQENVNHMASVAQDKKKSRRWTQNKKLHQDDDDDDDDNMRRNGVSRAISKAKGQKKRKRVKSTPDDLFDTSEEETIDSDDEDYYDDHEKEGKKSKASKIMRSSKVEEEEDPSKFLPKKRRAIATEQQKKAISDTTETQPLEKKNLRKLEQQQQERKKQHRPQQPNHTGGEHRQQEKQQPALADEIKRITKKRLHHREHDQQQQQQGANIRTSEQEDQRLRQMHAQHYEAKRKRELQQQQQQGANILTSEQEDQRRRQMHAQYFEAKRKRELQQQQQQGDKIPILEQEDQRLKQMNSQYFEAKRKKELQLHDQQQQRKLQKQQVKAREKKLSEQHLQLQQQKSAQAFQKNHHTEQLHEQQQLRQRALQEQKQARALEKQRLQALSLRNKLSEQQLQQQQHLHKISAQVLQKKVHTEQVMQKQTQGFEKKQPLPIQKEQQRHEQELQQQELHPLRQKQQQVPQKRATGSKVQLRQSLVRTCRFSRDAMLDALSEVGGFMEMGPYSKKKNPYSGWGHLDSIKQDFLILKKGNIVDPQTKKEKPVVKLLLERVMGWELETCTRLERHLLVVELFRHSCNALCDGEVIYLFKTNGAASLIFEKWTRHAMTILNILMTREEGTEETTPLHLLTSVLQLIALSRLIKGRKELDLLKTTRNVDWETFLQDVHPVVCKLRDKNLHIAFSSAESKIKQILRDGEEQSKMNERRFALMIPKCCSQKEILHQHSGQANTEESLEARRHLKSDANGLHLGAPPVLQVELSPKNSDNTGLMPKVTKSTKQIPPTPLSTMDDPSQKEAVGDITKVEFVGDISRL